MWLIAAAALSTVAVPAAAASTHEVLADAPTDLSVTVYRAPERGSGSLDLDDLNGFALIRETRVIHLSAGENRVRFEDVADGIEPASAIVTGLRTGIVEKNRDAQLLSPSGLVAASVGKSVMLVRTSARTGKTERLPGTILSDDDGVVFKTEAGVESLRCSGLSETFTFTGVTGLSATPTLSVIVRTTQPLTEVVTLSYLARGFDWGANYTATLSANGGTIDLGAWVTLANSNGVSFPAAHTQVVAGRVNRESGDIEAIDVGGPVLAKCWPMGSTSSGVELLQVVSARPLGFEDALFKRLQGGVSMPMSVAVQEVMVTGMRVTQERLGDLKLYRVPERTTVASRQSKQVRLLDRMSIPVRRIYMVELTEDANDTEQQRAAMLLRTKNNAANHLGLPLPSGSVAVFGVSRRGRLLLNESGIHDLAVDEDVEINMGTSSDVQVRSVVEETAIDGARRIPLVPGVVALREVEVDDATRVQISNASESGVQFELRLRLEEGTRVIRADHPLDMKNGRPEFNLTVPAHRIAIVRYQTAREQVAPVRE